MGRSKSPRVLDLFAGCGGMTRGLLDAGDVRLVGAVEWNLDAASTYAANFGSDHVFYGDIAEYGDVPSADLVIGGPPCQGFSNLGKKDPKDARNTLFREFARVVHQSGANVFVFENVQRFARTAEHGLLHDEAADGGLLEGFELDSYVLNAADFGASQRRSRAIVVGSRIGAIDRPLPSHSRLGEGQDRWRGVRAVLESLDFHPTAKVLPDDERVTSFFDGATSPGPFKLDEIHIGRNYRDKSIERYRLIAPGKSRYALPEHLLYDCWKTHTTGAADVLGRLEWDQPSVTIRTEFFKPEKGRYLHPQWEDGGEQVNRALTHAEAALLQGFDDRHVWCGTKIEIARQIGNAVPPPLARAVGSVVLPRLR